MAVTIIMLRPFCSRDQNTPNVIADQNSWSLMLTVLLVSLSLSPFATVQDLALSRFKSKRLEHLVSTLYLTGRGSPHPRVVSLADSLPILVDCRGYVLLVALSILLSIDVLYCYDSCSVCLSDSVIVNCIVIFVKVLDGNVVLSTKLLLSHIA